MKVARFALWRPARRASLCLLFAASFLGLPATAQDSGQTKVDAFAKCLTQKKATLYGSFLCPHCDDQRKVFGQSFAWVPYVECSMVGSRQETSSCQAAHIRYTPTWVFADGDRYVGVQSLKQLSVKTGCPLP